MTFWGLLMVLLAFILLIQKGIDGIFKAFVLTAPLFITVVTTIPLGATELHSSYFFGAIFIVLSITTYTVRIEKNLRQNSIEIKNLYFHKDLIPAYAFLLIITASLFMPFFLENDIKVISFESGVGMLEDLTFKNLEFQQSNLTQLIYPYFQIIIFTVAASYITVRNYVRSTIDLLVKSSCFVLLTGVVHIFLRQIGGDIVLVGINNILTGGNSPMNDQGGLLGLARMYSWAGEPGYSAFLFLAIMGIIIGELLTNNYLINKTRRRTFIVFPLFLFGIILSTGTTGYVGIIILFMLAFLSSYAISENQVSIQRKYLVLPVVLLPILFIGLQLFTGFSFFEYFQEEHFSKLTELSGSGMVRFTIVAQNFQHFLISPILGIGYGSERSLALSAFLLANAGLAGFISFSLIGLLLMKKMWNVMKSKYASLNQKTLALGMFISFGTMLVLMQFAKSESSLLFHYFWVIGACMLAHYRIFISQKKAILHASDH